MHKLMTVLIRAALPCLAAFIFAMISSGCGKVESAAAKDELVVLCGSSFVKPMEVLIQEFKERTGIDVVTTVAGSEDFLPLVKAGRKGDVLVTHDPYLQYVTEAGALGDHAAVGFLSPVLAVQEGNPQGLKSIEDLTRPGLKVALTDPKYSTCGEMVFALLEKKGLKEKVKANVENRLTKGHSTLGTFLKTRTVDAVIMWNGVAHDFEDGLDTVKTLYEYDQEIGVHVIGLNYTKRPGPLKAFIDFAKERGPAVFSEHGYVK